MTTHVPTVGRPQAPGRLWLALFAVLALLLVAPAPYAGAHAQLLRSTPADGAVVDTAPESIELVFNEDINPAFAQMIVRDASGTTLSTPEPTVAGPKVTGELPDLKPGRVTVLFRVTSKDAHPISGKVTFTIDGGDAPVTSDSDAAAAPGAGGDTGTTTGQDYYLGTSSFSGASGPPSAWMYALVGVLALGMAGFGGFLLRNQRPNRSARLAPTTGH